MHIISVLLNGLCYQVSFEGESAEQSLVSVVDFVQLLLQHPRLTCGTHGGSEGFWDTGKVVLKFFLECLKDAKICKIMKNEKN